MLKVIKDFLSSECVINFQSILMNGISLPLGLLFFLATFFSAEMVCAAEAPPPRKTVAAPPGRDAIVVTEPTVVTPPATTSTTTVPPAPAVDGNTPVGAAPPPPPKYNGFTAPNSAPPQQQMPGQMLPPPPPMMQPQQPGMDPGAIMQMLGGALQQFSGPGGSGRVQRYDSRGYPDPEGRYDRNGRYIGAPSAQELERERDRRREARERREEEEVPPGERRQPREPVEPGDPEGLQPPPSPRAAAAPAPGGPSSCTEAQNLCKCDGQEFKTLDKAIAISKKFYEANKTIFKPDSRIAINDYRSKVGCMYIVDTAGKCNYATTSNWGRGKEGEYKDVPTPSCENGSNLSPAGFHITRPGYAGENGRFNSENCLELAGLQGQKSGQSSRGILIHQGTCDGAGKTKGCAGMGDFGKIKELLGTSSLVYNYFGSKGIGEGRGKCTGAADADKGDLGTIDHSERGPSPSAGSPRAAGTQTPPVKPVKPVKPAGHVE